MMDITNEIFIIDSDVLIEPYKTYYSFKFYPEFWVFIEKCILKKKIVLLDMVYNEIVLGNDSLSAWIKNIQGIELLDHKKNNIIQHYASILNFIQTSNCYKEDALHSWSASTVADPFIVATAIENKYTLITGEQPNNNLNEVNPSSKVKIPNICNEFRIKWGNLFYMLTQLEFRSGDI